MPNEVATGWLKNKNGDKFAPKTLTSQVQTSDGILIEDKIQAEISEELGVFHTNITKEFNEELSTLQTNIKKEFDTFDNQKMDIVTPTKYGAVGNGTADDTAAFKSALENNRFVYVYGGTYNISEGLDIKNNSCLELAQDAVLNFTNTSGNCITLHVSACLRGNHATVKVPYGFSGKVINVDTALNTTGIDDVPPWSHWDPQWETARYLTDLNICMADSFGVHRSATGDTSGIAVYISADGNAKRPFIWGMNFSGLRIAGAFDYGIRAVNYNTYNHEMRIEAFIDAPKVGVSLEDCKNSYVSATIQPREAADGTVYATHGIELIRSRNTDLLGSRVWDWDNERTLWTNDKDNINQHIAMYGDCRGTILNDFLYYQLPAGFNDLRELIYCEDEFKETNLGSLIIIQEPITRWFKPVDNEPYFNDGHENNRLVLKKEQDALFQTDYIPTFENKLLTAVDENGEIFNGIGYMQGARWNVTSDTIELATTPYHVCTGLIPCNASTRTTVRIEGMSFKDGDDYDNVIWFDADRKKLGHLNRGLFINNDISVSGFHNYTPTENGFSFEIHRGDTRYLAFTFKITTLTNNPIVTINEEIVYTQEGFLADEIYVKSDYITGLEQTIDNIEFITVEDIDEICGTIIQVVNNNSEVTF